MDSNDDFYIMLGYLANILQVANFQMNLSQISNDEIMKHLLEQDKILDSQNNMLQEQTNIYLKKIINQNQEIINLLKGDKNGSRD